MDFVLFVYVYFGGTALLVAVLLFGDAPAFAGTPVAGAKWLLSEGWLVALEWVVDKAAGERGLQVLDAAAVACCEQSNPTLQVAYLLIFLFGYYLYWRHVFTLLPNDGAGEVHIFTGTAAVCATLLSFVAASCQLPGRVTRASEALYAEAFPPDGLLFPPKRCATCGLQRPGRSKHCGPCGGCVPRFDHHCGWINNCVGLANTRTFLAFLLANLALCAYGVALTAAVLKGELRRRGLLDAYVYDLRLRARVPLHHRPSRLIEWLLVFHPIPVALGTFMAIAGLLMAAFLLYQGCNITAGTTTYETAKRNAMHREWREAAAAAAAAGAASAGAGAVPWPARLWRRGSGSGGAAAPQRVPAPPNSYDRGFASNWSEVLFPGAFLAAAAERLERRSRAADGAAAAAAGPAGGGGEGRPEKKRK